MLFFCLSSLKFVNQLTDFYKLGMNIMAMGTSEMTFYNFVQSLSRTWPAPELAWEGVETTLAPHN
jgi:hypothetical protein